MQMKKKYQVFVSSTYEDLKEERMAVMRSLLDINCIPVGMEQFPANGMDQMDYIKKMLDDCDYYILITAGRYGSLADDGVGYTEKEFDYAKSKGIPVMAFIAKDIGNLPSVKCEQTDKGRELLREFHEKVKQNGMVNFYTTAEDLQLRIAISIHKCIEDFPAVGWVRGNDVPPPEDLEARFEDFMSKHTATKEDIDALFKEIESKPNIHVGAEPPSKMKDGDLWVQLVDDKQI